jgi:hypothetical protein
MGFTLWPKLTQQMRSWTSPKSYNPNPKHFSLLELHRYLGGCGPVGEFLEGFRWRKDCLPWTSVLPEEQFYPCDYRLASLRLALRSARLTLVSAHISHNFTVVLLEPH